VQFKQAAKLAAAGATAPQGTATAATAAATGVAATAAATDPGLGEEQSRKASSAARKACADAEKAHKKVRRAAEKLEKAAALAQSMSTGPGILIDSTNHGAVPPGSQPDATAGATGGATAPPGLEGASAPGTPKDEENPNKCADDAKTPQEAADIAKKEAKCETKKKLLKAKEISVKRDKEAAKKKGAEQGKKEVF